MRDMNDNLLVAFVIRLSLFISVWIVSVGFVNRKGYTTERFCTGIFNDHDQIMDPQISPEKLPQPYTPLFWSLCITTLFFIVSVRIRRRKISLDDVATVTIGTKRPKDLESILLNFTLIILLTINLLGFQLFWNT